MQSFSKIPSELVDLRIYSRWIVLENTKFTVLILSKLWSKYMVIITLTLYKSCEGAIIDTNDGAMLI